MPKQSAGILIYRGNDSSLKCMLVHPGGPFWRKKDEGAWSIPKGEFETGEDPLDAAIRELEEETGQRVDGEFLALEPIIQKGGKKVFAFAINTEFNVSGIESNTFEMEWPPRSGKKATFPEVDRAAWFSINEARKKIIPSQEPLLDQLVHYLKTGR